MEFTLSKKQNINKRPKFDDHFDIRRQSEHFENEMIQA